MLLAPLRRTLRWLVSLADAEGRIVCPDHKVEHSGKNAYVIVLAAELAKHDPAADRAWLRDVAVRQGRRLVANLLREGESTCFTFRPGRHDPFNCSNNVIDGGACSDALAELVQVFGAELSAEDRAAFERASVLHAQTYLRYAVLDKGIPAQSAWALTGVANAWKLSGHAVLELTVNEGAGRLFGLQHRDGSYPYHPLEEGAAHVGSSDVSAFYQSRVTAFLLFALHKLGRDPARPPFRMQIAAGLEFLRALVGPDGVKVGGLEAKPWYWGAEYEVASNPFDVYALAIGGRALGDPSLIQLARGSFDAWARHVDADGVPRDHRPGPGRRRSYQCPVFWAGHAAWAARALSELNGVRPEPASDGLVIDVRHFKGAGLARLEDRAVIAWVRGARPAGNVHHGSPRGAGLLRVFGKADGRDLWVAGAPNQRAGEGEWTGRVGGWSRARARASVAGELRFSGWLARAYARRGEWGRGLRTPLEVAWRGGREFGTARASSAFVLDPALHVMGDGVELASGVAWRDGARVPGVELSRRYRVEGDGLLVEEHLQGAGALRFVPPRGAGVSLVEATPTRAVWRVGHIGGGSK
ncbi:MAG: hypothetical protein R3F49_01935 [Planctomycetota bacterium]